MTVWAWLHLAAVVVTAPGAVWCNGWRWRAVLVTGLLVNAVMLGIEIARAAP